MDKSLLIRHGGTWDKNKNCYLGGSLTGIVVPMTVKYEELKDHICEATRVSSSDFDIIMRVQYKLEHEEAPPQYILNDRDVRFILRRSEFSFQVFVTVERKQVHDENIGVSILDGGHASLNMQNSESSYMHRGEQEIPMTMPSESVMSLDNENTNPCEPQVTVRDAEHGWGKNDKWNSESYVSTINNDKDETPTSEVNTGLQSEGVNHVVCENEVGPTPIATECGSSEVGPSVPRRSSRDLILHDPSSSGEDVEVGQIFLSKKDLNMRLSILVMNNNHEFRVKKSNKDLYTIGCVDKSCKWRLRAVKMKGCEIFQITKYANVHTCFIEILNHDHRQASASVISHIIKDKFTRVGHLYKPRHIIEDVRLEYGVNISYDKACRAREIAYVETTILPPKKVPRVGRRRIQKSPLARELRSLTKCGRCGNTGHNRQTCNQPLTTKRLNVQQ